jgi:hypothetical protein
MRGLEKLAQSIGFRLVDGGRSLDEFGARVEGPTAAIDLDEEIRRAQSIRTLEQRVDSRGVVEDAIAALREDPEPARRGRAGRGLGYSARTLFWREGRLPFGKFICGASHQPGRKRDPQGQTTPGGSELIREEAHNAHTVTSRVLWLNGGHSLDDATIGPKRVIFGRSSL